MSAGNLVKQINGKQRFRGWFIPYARKTLADWRARHPLIRVVEPLPIDEHTERANQDALNTSPQAQWDRDALMYLCFENNTKP